jgi:lipoprotein-anchoring transpeptidase ErfK/SrfK
MRNHITRLFSAMLFPAAAAMAAAQPTAPPTIPQAAGRQTGSSPAAPASQQPQAQAIEQSRFSDLQPPASPATPNPAAPQPVVIKVETFLDRAHFSPGVIDGKRGENLDNAVAAYAKAHKLPGNGGLTAQVFAALASADKQPVTQDYTIMPDDEKGPFIGKLPSDFAAQAALGQLGYLSPEQELAERFHMSEALLRALNPGANFGAAGTSIVVLQPGNGDLGDTIAQVEVDKSNNQLRAYDGSGKLVAAFPATVGSIERPAPDGTWAVAFVTFNPDYTYDPKRLTFGKKSEGPLKIAPGPNNPVGSTWIQLTKPTYGIHGAPDPALVGKTASHGCIRLTNWDATALGHAVRKGTEVVFLGEATKG